MNNRRLTWNIDKNYKKSSGIYKITNSKNSKVYIGSAADLVKRFRLHRYMLESERHHSILLQRFYNKYKEVKFEFCLLEICDKKDLLITEQKWLDIYKSYDVQYGFNICNKAASTLGVGKTLESIAKMKDTWAKNGGHPSFGKPSKLRGTRLSQETEALD